PARAESRGKRQGRRQDRGRDGGADRSLDRLPHYLRHGESRGSGHVILWHPPRREDRRLLQSFQALMALLSVAEALARVTQGLEPLGAESVALDSANGRVLAGDLPALLTPPAVPGSALDHVAAAA